MTHLRIENQNSNTEIVNTAIILKVYEMALSAEGSVSLKGNLLTEHAKQTAYNYLTGNLPDSNTKRFPELSINVTDGLYINFADPEVERVLLANNIGDGVGITTTMAAATSGVMPAMFRGNTTITSFDELALFGWNKLYAKSDTTASNGGFYNCTSLKSIDLDNIVEISGNTNYKHEFANCTSLTTVKNMHFSPQVGMFLGCTSLQSIDLSESVWIGNSSFSGCTSLTTVTTSTNNNFTIGPAAFKGCNNLTTIDLSHCTSIGGDSNAGAFQSCSLLNNIDISNVISIGTEAFKGCTSLSNVTWPQLAFTISSGAFLSCSALASADLTNCSSITNSYRMFNGCTRLSSVTLSNSITTLGEAFFNDCSSLTTVDTSHITKIYRLCFNGCISLTSLNLSSLDFTDSSVQEVFSIDNQNYTTFRDLTNLTTLGITRFPNITILGLRTFKGCSNLQGELNFPDLTTMKTSGYGGQFNGCSSLTKISLGHITSFSVSGSNVYSSRGVCGDCTSLKVLDLSDSLQTIYEGGCKGCSALEAVIINVSTPPTISYNNPSLENIFGNSNVNIYVPDAAVSTYLSTLPYSNFSAHILPLSQYNESTILGTTT